MATITERTVKSLGSFSTEAISAAAGPTDTVDIKTPEATPRCGLGVQLFDGAGDQIVDGSATGTFTVSVATYNNGAPESPAVSEINAASPVTVDWYAHTIGVTVVPDSLVGVTTWRVVFTTEA